MPTLQKLPSLKAGDTFFYGGSCKLPLGSWTATCQLRSRTEPYPLIGEVTVTLGLATAGGDTPVVLRAEAQHTVAWAPEIYALDIRYADMSTGEVMHTSTMLLPVIRSVTQPSTVTPAAPND